MTQGGSLHPGSARSASQSTSTRELPATAADTSAERPWPVRLLSVKIEGYVARMPAVWVEGQVVQLSNRPGTATVFLTLRDTDADMSLPVTAHRRVVEGLGTSLGEGARVVVHARPVFWPRRGALSLAADAVRPVGVGELLARLEHLKRVLAAEGLFAPDRKRALPFLPATVGLVCGRASAAERDVVGNARRRWPAVRFRVLEVAVQGPTAVTEVTAAVRALDADDSVEVIVVTRGGGSVEDLLPFSAEPLLRAVAACRTPLVSAIGHEVDSPLLDLVADVRASTPTDAARRVVPDVGELTEAVAHLRQRARGAISQVMSRHQQALDAIRSRPALTDPGSLVRSRADGVLGARQAARRALDARLHRALDQAGHLRAQVRALSPAGTLARGYAVVQTAAGRVVRAPQEVDDGALLRLRLAGGDLSARAVRPAG